MVMMTVVIIIIIVWMSVDIQCVHNNQACISMMDNNDYYILAKVQLIW